LENKDVEE